MTPRVVVLGDLATDVVVELHAEPVPGSDVDATIRQLGGGAGANVAAWLATAGASARLVGRVGDDGAGAERVAELRARGIDVRVAVDPAAPTGTIVAVATPDGERTLYADRGANLNLTDADVPEAVLASTIHLHLSGYALLHPLPRPAARAALGRARDRGMTTSVDVSSAAPLATAGAGAFREWTHGVDLCRGNRQEAEVMTGAADPVTACRRLGASYPLVVVTDGRAGAWAGAAGEVLHVPAAPADVVDTVGAGDAFTAGLLAGLLAAGWRTGVAPARDVLEEACRRAASLAARAVSVAGGRPPSS